MVLKIYDKSEQKRTQKHKLIEKLLLKNNMENLHQIDPQLVEFLGYKEEFVSKTETLEEWFNIEFIPFIPPRTDLGLFLTKKIRHL